MKRIIIITLALLCVFTFMSCKQDPKIIQSWTTIDTAPIGGWYYAANDTTRYAFDINPYGPVTLKIWSKDMMTDTWPKKPVTYTGTMSTSSYSKTITETETLKETMSIRTCSVVFDTVDDPMYGPTVHSYDGDFDVAYVSGYQVNDSDTGFVQWSKPSVARFEVSMNSNNAPSTLIGLGNWMQSRPW